MTCAGGQEALHTMDCLIYAYLQTAQDRKAEQVVDELAAFGKAPAGLPAAYAIAAIPARFALERRNRPEATALTAPPVAALPRDRLPWAEAIISFTRAVGAALTRQFSGDPAGAGATAKAKRLYEQLVALCSHANTKRPELLRARALAVRG